MIDLSRKRAIAVCVFAACLAVPILAWIAFTLNQDRQRDERIAANYRRSGVADGLKRLQMAALIYADWREVLPATVEALPNDSKVGRNNVVALGRILASRTQRYFFAPGVAGKKYPEKEQMLIVTEGEFNMSVSSEGKVLWEASTP